MWAEIIPISAGPWVVGIRVDTEAARRSVATHYSQRVIDADGAPSNYTIIAPHLMKGHGTLYRAGEPIKESRRLSVLLDALDTEMSTLAVPEGMIRIVARTPPSPHAPNVVLEPQRRDAELEPPSEGSNVWFVDAATLEVVGPGDTSRATLAGVIVRSTVIQPQWLLEMATPATPGTIAAWEEVLAELSRRGRLAAVADRQDAQKLTERWRRSG